MSVLCVCVWPSYVLGEMRGIKRMSVLCVCVWPSYVLGETFLSVACVFGLLSLFCFRQSVCFLLGCLFACFFGSG